MDTPPIHILVVDDNPDVLRGTVRLLEQAGYVIATASNGVQALLQIQKALPDLVLLDWEMPELNGMEVCSRIKRDAALADVFVVMLSGARLSTDDQIAGLNTGADAYITRPIGNRELLARVAAYVRIVRLQQRLREKEAKLAVANAELVRENTARRISEEQLVASERFLTTAIDALSASICVLDRTGSILLVNRAWRDFYHADTFVAGDSSFGKGANYLTVCDAAKGNDAELAIQMANGIRRVSDGSTSEFSLEYPCDSPTEKRWFHAKVSGFMDGSGRVVVSHEDITDRKLAQAAQQASEARWKSLTAFLPIGVFHTDPHGACLYTNPSWQTIHGMTLGDSLGDGWSSRLHADDAGAVLGEWQRAAAAGQDFDMTFRVWRSDGVVRNVRSRARPECDDHGDLIGYVGTVSDVTERELAKEALELSEAKFSSAFEFAAIGIALVSPEGRWLKVNRAVCQMLQYTESELLVKTFQDITHPDDLEIDLEYVLQMLKGEIETYQMEKRYFTQSGQTLWVLLSVSLVRDHAGTPVHFVSQIQNIHKRKEAEHSLLLAKAEAERANSAKSQFVSNMSHEIRTPMNAILGLAYVLESAALSADQHDLVRKIRVAGRSLLAIINDILDFSKIEAGRLEIEHIAFDLDMVLENIATIMGANMGAKPVELLLRPAPTLAGRLVGDALRLEQVLINLTNNAIKFTEKGEIEVLISVLAQTDQTVRLRFSVRDTGIGIAAKNLPQLFQPFSRFSGTTAEGTGIGLSISQRLMAMMGGCLLVASEPNKGSEFWFELPFGLDNSISTAVVKRTRPQPALEISTGAGPRLTGLSILVVDDSSTNLDVAKLILTREGAQVLVAMNGQEAIDHLRAKMVDCVLMDVQMPVMDGITATRLIRKDPGLSGVPVIALTAGVLGKQREEATQAGMNDFIPKPFDVETLIETLLRWVPQNTASSMTSMPAPHSAVTDPPGDIPVIAGIDTKAVQYRLGFGNRELFLSMLRQLLAEFKDTEHETRADLERGDPSAAARRLHKLHGGAGSLAAVTVATAARALEAAIKAGPEQEIPLLLSNLANALAQLSQAAAVWLEKSTVPEMAADADCIKDQALQPLITALSNHSLDALKLSKALQGGMAARFGSAPTAALVDDIEGLRFDEALLKLNQQLQSAG